MIAGPERLLPALAHQTRPATPFPHLSSSRASNSPAPFPTASHHSKEATTRFGLRGHLGGGHNESGSRQAGPIARRKVGTVGRGTCEEAGEAVEAQRRRPARMELLCASRLTQRAAAHALAPPVLSLVPNTLATSPLTPTIPARQSSGRLAQTGVSFPLTGTAPPLPYPQPPLPTQC